MKVISLELVSVVLRNFLEIAMTTSKKNIVLTAEQKKTATKRMLVIGVLIMAGVIYSISNEQPLGTKLSEDEKSALIMVEMAATCTGFYSQWRAGATDDDCENFGNMTIEDPGYLEKGTKCYALLTDRWYEHFLTGGRKFSFTENLNKYIEINRSNFDQKHNFGVESNTPGPTYNANLASTCKNYIDDMLPLFYGGNK
jgi:hypothetical protein